MPVPRRVAVGAIVVMATTAVSVARAAPVDEAAVVQQAAFRLDPPDIEPWPIEERAGRQLLELINEFRSSESLSPVEWDPQITLSAQSHAGYMARTSRLSHEGRFGSTAGDRLDEVDVDWLRWGENVGAGYRSPQAIFDSWIASDAHRANLLGDYESAGVGVATNDSGTPYWVLVLVGNSYLL